MMNRSYTARSRTRARRTSRLRTSAPILGLLILAGALWQTSRPADPARATVIGTGPGALLQLEKDPAVFNVLYRWGGNKGAPSGAYGPNITAPRSAWFIEYQRAGAVNVIDGALRTPNDVGLAASGLKMFHWGLARETSSGSFPGSAWPFHGVALFLSEAAPALIILQHSAIAQPFQAEIRWETARMRRAAYAMVRSVGGPGKIDDTTKNHRYFEAGLALGATGILSGDRTLVRWSQRYIRHAIGMQRADGVMPEDGGHDSGYQAVGLIDAARYEALLATGSLLRSLRHAVQRGEAWELSRIASNGSVNQSGDTRTAGCAERDPAGNCKTVFYAPIFSALAHWAALSGSSAYASAAHRVWLRSGYSGH